jgi:hypothetical protein
MTSRKLTRRLRTPPPLTEQEVGSCHVDKERALVCVNRSAASSDARELSGGAFAKAYRRQATARATTTFASDGRASQECATTSRPRGNEDVCSALTEVKREPVPRVMAGRRRKSDICRSIHCRTAHQSMKRSNRDGALARASVSWIEDPGLRLQLPVEDDRRRIRHPADKRRGRSNC